MFGCILWLTGCDTTGGRNSQHSFDTVVVDAGHGGYDVGTRSSRQILEKDAAFDIAVRLNQKLRSAGLRTVMTRKSDTFISLDNRVAMSNRERNAIFVSVHLNEARSRPDIHGVETYYYSPRSIDLARSILAKVAVVPGETGRGIHTARFRVLRMNANPSVLVECGYLSNKSEASRMVSAAYRDAIATAIAAGVVEQKRGKKAAAKVSAVTPPPVPTPAAAPSLGTAAVEPKPATNVVAAGKKGVNATPTPAVATSVKKGTTSPSSKPAPPVVSPASALPVIKGAPASATAAMPKKKGTSAPSRAPNRSRTGSDTKKEPAPRGPNSAKKAPKTRSKTSSKKSPESASTKKTSIEKKSEKSTPKGKISTVKKHSDASAEKKKQGKSTSSSR